MRDYSDAYMMQTITVNGNAVAADFTRNIIRKICVPSTDSITKINNLLIANVE